MLTRFWKAPVTVTVDEQDGRPDSSRNAEERLRRAKKMALEAAFEAGRFRAALDGMTDGYLTLDGEWICTYLNAAAEKIFGLPREQAVGRSVRDNLPQPVIELLQQAYDRSASSRGFTPAGEYQIGSAWLEMRVFSNDVGLALFVHDVTERELVVRESERRFRRLAEQIPAALYIDALDNTTHATQFMSPRIEQITGYPPESWLDGVGFWDTIIHPDDHQARLDALSSTAPDGGDRPYRVEYRITTRDERVIWIRNEAIMIRDDDGTPLYWQGFVTDITDQKLHESNLTHRMLHDPLTGLPHRVLFQERATQALARASRRGRMIGMLFIDLDEFKLINDTMGHHAGDELLVMAARRCLASVRAGDTVARFGGDEFTVLLDDVASVDEAVMVARRISVELAEPFVLVGQGRMISASIGVALSTAATSDPASLIRRADHAMYDAKHSGKNRIVVAPQE